jgi:hypothetical protein
MPDRLRRFWRRLRGCPVCHGERKMLHYGGKMTADLQACSWCDDGRKLADTLYPAVYRTPPAPPPPGPLEPPRPPLHRPVN